MRIVKQNRKLSNNHASVSKLRIKNTSPTRQRVKQRRQTQQRGSISLSVARQELTTGGTTLDPGADAGGKEREGGYCRCGCYIHDTARALGATHSRTSQPTNDATATGRQRDRPVLWHPFAACSRTRIRFVRTARYRVRRRSRKHEMNVTVAGGNQTGCCGGQREVEGRDKPYHVRPYSPHHRKRRNPSSISAPHPPITAATSPATNKRFP